MSSLLSYKNWNAIEAGCDEAGRGCLAGPVVAAAVILPKDFSNELLNDSKKLTESVRKKLRPIIEKEAIAFGVAFVFEDEIDHINILNASSGSHHRSCENDILYFCQTLVEAFLRQHLCLKLSGLHIGNRSALSRT